MTFLHSSSPLYLERDYETEIERTEEEQTIQSLRKTSKSENTSC